MKDQRNVGYQYPGLVFVFLDKDHLLADKDLGITNDLKLYELSVLEEFVCKLPARIL